jgi:hypothetical protein
VVRVLLISHENSSWELLVSIEALSLTIPFCTVINQESSWEKTNSANVSPERFFLTWTSIQYGVASNEQESGLILVHVVVEISSRAMGRLVWKVFERKKEERWWDKEETFGLDRYALKWYVPQMGQGGDFRTGSLCLEVIRTAKSKYLCCHLLAHSALYHLHGPTLGRKASSGSKISGASNEGVVDS